LYSAELLLSNSDVHVMLVNLTSPVNVYGSIYIYIYIETGSHGNNAHNTYNTDNYLISPVHLYGSIETGSHDNNTNMLLNLTPPVHLYSYIYKYRKFIK